MIARQRLKPQNADDLIRRSTRRQPDLDLRARPSAVPFGDQELIEAMGAPLVVGLFADDGERELVVHRDFAAPSTMIVFRDRDQAQVFVAGANAYATAGTKAALVLCEVRANLMRDA
jgi:hypothetical protein